LSKIRLILALAAILFFCSTAFSATYLKGVTSSDLNHFFDYNGPVWIGSNTNSFWTTTGALDWNVDAVADSDAWQDPNLQAYFKFDSTDGTTVVDSSSNGEVGTFVGSASISSIGIWDSNAATGFGNDNYISFANKSTWDFGTDPFTISYWVHPTADSGYRGHLSGSTDVDGYWVLYSVNDLTLKLTTTRGAGAIVSGAMTAGKWNHVVLTRVGTGDSDLKMYINGVLKSTASGNVALNANGAMVAGRFYNNTSGYPLAGQLDELKIYDRGFTQADVSTDYNSWLDGNFVSSSNSIIDGSSIRDWQTVSINTDTNYNFNSTLCGSLDTGCPEETYFSDENLIGLWHLDGDAIDSSGNGNDGTWAGSQLYSSGLWDKSAGNFAGTDDYISINDSNFDFEYNRPFSGCVWINPDAYGWQAIMGKQQGSGIYRGWSFNMYGNNDITLSIISTWSSSYITEQAEEVIKTGRWQHVCFTYDGTGTKAGTKLYYDGLEMGTITAGSSITGSIQNSEILKLGADRGAGLDYDGQMQDAAMWDKELTADKIMSLYRRGITKLDLNVYSCTDADCTTRTSSQYFTDMNNNEIETLTISNSTYMGYDAFFRTNPDFQSYSANYKWTNAFLQNISVDAISGNQAPVLTLNTLEGNALSGALPYFSNAADANLVLDVDVTDTDGDDLNLTVRYSTSTVQGSGTIILDSIDLKTLANCDDTDFTDATRCDVNFSTVGILDNNYYLLVELDEGVTATVSDNSTNKFGVDNTAPAISVSGHPADWQRTNASITLTCDDSTGSGCATTYYRLNSGSWQTYSSAISIVNDGNHQLDVNTVDAKSNWSDVNTYYVPIGFNGELTTYNDSNQPRSFFGAGETVRFVFDANNASTPTIKIVDVDGNVLVNGATMSNYSGDTNFGVTDLNTYYFSYDVNGSLGWYDVTIQNQLFEDAFYRSGIWTDKYTSYDGNSFPFSFDLNVWEPNGLRRWFAPIDTNNAFTFNADFNSIRVLDYNGSDYLEIPSQLHNVTYNGSLVSDANVVFLSSLDKNELRQYFVSYSIIDLYPNYSTDLNVTDLNVMLDINTSYFKATIDINQGGVLDTIKSHMGTDVDFNSVNPLELAPLVLKGAYTYTSNNETDPIYTIESGPVFSRIRVQGTVDSVGIDIFDYNLNYTTYAKSKFIKVDSNILIKSTLSSASVYDIYAQLENGQMTKLAYDNGTLTTKDMNSLDNTFTPDADANYVALFNKNSLNAFGIIQVSESSSKTISNTLSVSDASTELVYTKRMFYGSIVANDSFISNKLVTVFNPMREQKDINELFFATQNPLTINIGSIATNDSSFPVSGDVNYSPFGDVNDAMDVNCFANIWDDTIISSMILNVNGPNVDVNFSEAFSDSNVFMDYNVDASYLNGGDFNCAFYATDVAGNVTVASISFDVNDASAPVIDGNSLSPDSNASIDPSTRINFDVNVIEFVGLSSVVWNVGYLLADNNWSDWNAITMVNDVNYGDYNYSFDANYYTASDDNTYRYFIRATDVNSNVTDSNLCSDANCFTNFYSNYDWTWTSSPATFGNVSGSLDTIVSVGTVTVTNTGDKNLSVLINSDWEDKYEVWYAGEPETATGYTFTSNTGDVNTFAVTLKTKPTERSDALTITVNPTNALASPDSNTITATIVSLSDGPFMLVEWVEYDVAVTQGDANVVYSVRVTNAGNSDANNMFVDWNVPSDWALASGVDYLAVGDLAVNASVTSTVAYDIGADATVGDTNVSFYTGCCFIADKNQSTYKTVSVVEAGGTTGGGDDDDDDDTGGAGGTGGNNASAGLSGGSIFDNVQSDVFFQTSAFFELVRGEDSSFNVKIENPLNGYLKDLRFSVTGLSSKYVRLTRESFDLLDSNEFVNVGVEIVSPKYFAPGEYELTFVVEGIFVDDRNREVSFSEERAIVLLIHDVSGDDARDLLAELQFIVGDMQDRGFALAGLDLVLADVPDLLRAKQYDVVGSLVADAKATYELALEVDIGLGVLVERVRVSNLEGVPTTNTSRLLSLASLAFSRGDYAVAAERLEEAEFTYGLEVKGEFNWFVWLLAHLVEVIVSIIVLAFVLWLLSLWLRLVLIKRKLRLFTSEGDLLLTLIQGIQTKCFIENKISIGEYYDALEQFESRLASVSEGVIEYESRKMHLLKFSSAVKRLSQEKTRLLDLIKETQDLYFNLGLVETRIYKTKIGSLTKRLSEVEEKIVSSEYLKLTRTTRGWKKGFWKIYYKIRK